MMGSRKDDADAYVQDGLVFQLDGFHIGESVWVDRKSGIEFSLNDKCTTGNGYLYLDHGGLRSSQTFSDEIWPENTITVEIVASCQGNNRIFAIPYMKTSRGTVFGYYSGQLLAFVRPLYLGIRDMPSNWRIISISKSNAMVDFAEHAVVNVGDYFPYAGNTIAVGIEFTGLIYAIRVYNRQLSIAEMLANQRIDNERFNLGRL